MKRPFKGLEGFRTLAIGFAIGFVVGSASLAAAAFGRLGWERFGPMFKQGYVAGFIDCVRIAKSIDPFSYIATQFPAPPMAKPIVWMRTVDELYAKDEHKDRTLAQILMIAGAKLQKVYGADKVKAGDQRLEALRQAIDRQRKALLQAKKTVEAAQDEVRKNGEGSTAKPADGEGAVGPEKSPSTPADPSPSDAQAPPTPEGLRHEGFVPHDSHGESAMPEDARAGAPIHPQADPDAPHKNEQDQQGAQDQQGGQDQQGAQE